MDYAGAVPLPARAQLPPVANAELYFDNDAPAGCLRQLIWHQVGDFIPEPLPAESANDPFFQYWGVFVRGPYFREGATEYWTGYTSPVRAAGVTDGLSKTALIVEKRLPPSSYDNGSGPADDRGWSDGWDWDALRLMMCKPARDTPDVGEMVVSPGSAHPAGINVGFADGSVRHILYGVNVETFNQMGHRSDGEVAASY